MKIAIQPDSVTQPNGERQSFSARWADLARRRGVLVQKINVFSPDALLSIRECDGLMWRYGFNPKGLSFAKMFLQSVEHGMGLPVYPNWRTSWHFEDKVAQAYLLEAAGIPTPRTTTHWNLDAALRFCRDESYPIVVKLTSGIRSNNVILVDNYDDASKIAKRLFSSGISTFSPSKRHPKSILTDNAVLRAAFNRTPLEKPFMHKSYFYAQEFLPNNEFDTRVTVIGERAFAFRRFNREADFRASGSGKICWNPDEIDIQTVRLALKTAKVLGTQSVAIDGMRRGDTRVVSEISYAYAAWAIEKCPGHWKLEGEPDNGPLRWVPGPMKAEDAIFDDFIKTIEDRRYDDSAE